MKKIQTLNEEIKRIKSLFGEERLYGNLVTENKILLKEQGYKSLKQIWDDVAEAVLKGSRREVTFGRGLGSIDAPRLSIKKLKNGDIKWYKGGVEIEPNIKNLLTNTTNRKIRNKINALVDGNDLEEFFSGEGLYDIYDDILKDLQLQKVIDGNKADELLASFRSANVSKKMQSKFFGDDKSEFFTGVVSIKDLKDVHPGVGELMDDIPGLEKKIEKILKQSKDHEIYDSEIVELARFFQGKGGFKNDGGQVAYYLDEANGEIRFVVDKGHPLSTNTGDIKKTFKTNLQDPNKINVTVDLKNISQKDLALLRRNLPDAKIPDIVDIPTKSVFKTQDDLMNYDDLADIQKQIDDIADDIIKRGKDGDITTTKVGKIKNKIENIITSTLNNEKFPLVDYFKELFSKKFRRDFNVKSWKSEGAGINPILDRVLTDKEKGYLDSFYTVKNAGDNRTPFIDSKLDPDLIKKGYTEGMIHPNAVLRDDYLDLMYARVKVPLVKVRKAFYSKQPDYRSTMKTVGRLLKNTAFFIPLGPYESIFMQVWGAITQTVLRICFTGTINKILAGDMLIDTAYAMYRTSCYEEVVKNIRSFSGLSNEAKDGLLGKDVEVTNDDGSTTPISAAAGLKPILDLVGRLTYDVSGTPPKYAPVDVTNIDDSMLTIIDVFSKDNRKITNEKFKINNLNPKNTGGDGWELKSYNNNNALKVYVDKDGNLCSKENYLDKTKCTTYHFSLTCGSFNDYYQDWRNSVDIEKIIEEMGMSVLWSIFVEQQNMQDLIINKSREITNDIYKDTVESLDVDGDGKFNVVKDTNKAIEKGKRSTERMISGGSGGSKTNNEYIKGNGPK